MLEESSIKAIVRTIMTEESRINAESEAKRKVVPGRPTPDPQEVARRAVRAELPSYRPEVPADINFPKAEANETYLGFLPLEAASSSARSGAGKDELLSGLMREKKFKGQLEREISIGMQSSKLLSKGVQSLFLF
jgi:hypothetical protein